MRDADRITELAGELSDLAQRLASRAELASWVHEERRRVADGYPRRSGGLEPVTAVSGTGDPTGGAATMTLPEQHVLRELIEALDQAVGLARRAEAKRLRLEHAARPLPAPTRKPLPPCANMHGCPDDALATGDSGRCGTCANYRRNHGGLDRTGRYARVAQA